VNNLKEEFIMKEITIVIKEGRVESVYGTDKDISINIIDLDIQDFEELENLEKEVKNISNSQYDLL
jgi:hypothetical protein